MADQTKKCTKCNEIRPLGDFSKQSNGKPKAECKICATKRAQMAREVKKVAAAEKTPYDLLCEKVKSVLESMDKTQDADVLANDFLIKIVAAGITDQANLDQMKNVKLDTVERFDDWFEYLLIDENARKYIYCMGKDVIDARNKHKGNYRVIRRDGAIHDKLNASRYTQVDYVAPAKKVAVPLPPKIVESPREKTYEDYFADIYDLKDEETYTIVERDAKKGTVYKTNITGVDIRLKHEIGHRFNIMRKDTPDNVMKKLTEIFQCGDYVHVPEPKKYIIADFKNLLVSEKEEKFIDFNKPHEKYVLTLEDKVENAKENRVFADYIEENKDYYVIDWNAKTYIKMNGNKIKAMVEFLGERVCKAYNICNDTDELIKIEYLKPKN